MSEKIKYYISFTVDAMARTTVEGPKGLSRDEVMELVNEQNAWPSTTVCHQCSDHVETADIIEEVEINTDDGSVWDKWSHEKSKKNEENQKVIDTVRLLGETTHQILNKEAREALLEVCRIAEGKK